MGLSFVFHISIVYLHQDGSVACGHLALLVSLFIFQLKVLLNIS